MTIFPLSSSVNTLSPRMIRAVFAASLLASILGLTGCHRAPQNAAELRRDLPRIYVGEFRLQGQTEPLHLRVTPHNLTERDTKVLEFNSVQYAVLDAHGNVQTEGDADIRGTISLPGLEIRLENIGNLSGGEDLIKPGSFQGKLSGDLQTGEADWTSGYGQKGHLKMQAEK